MHDDHDAFSDLAWRALENPADAALREQVAAALAADPTRAETWRRLREDYARAREAVPAALSRTQADRTDSIPPARLDALLRETRARSRLSPWWLAAAAAVVFLSGSFLWSSRDAAAPDLAAWSRRAPASLARALTAPLAEVAATATLPTLRSHAALQLRSPLLAAAAGPVPIAWLSPDNTTATLTIRENNRLIWTLPGATSPALTPALPPGHVYELTLVATGGTALRETFVTVPPPPSTAPGLDGLLATLTADPARLGEGVLAWHALPTAQRRSEAGIRVGLWLGVQARQPDLLAEATAAAQARLR